MSDALFDVDVTPHHVVTLSDGTEISVKLWRPRVPAGVCLPVVLESVPYRKDDFMLVDDEARHGFLAGRGFVGIRMDLRGTGSSSGALDDEASAREADDTAQVIAWAAQQPWSNGAVGLLGMSWGGMNALRVAGRNPPGLRAVATAHATDDRYEDDALYLGGALLGDALLSWSAKVQHFAALPPDPHVVGTRWREKWLERLAALPEPAVIWASHQRRDAYWHADGDIAVPVLALGGWADPFHDTVLRLLDRLGPASCGILGPWGHTQPYGPMPGPGIGWLQECVAWFDRHLRGAPASSPPPRLRYYIQDAIELSAAMTSRPGTWCEADGSDFGATVRPWPLGEDGVLGARARSGTTVSHRSPLTAGGQAGDPMPYADGFAAEQTDDDALALAFTSAPLDEQILVAGRPLVRLRLAADAPNVVLVARLTDVHPDGRSFHITRGVLNAAHRRGHDTEVAPLVPGQWTDVALPLLSTATRIPAGHRLRLAISTQSWPLLWPLPREATIEVDLAGSVLELPELEEPRALRHPFPPPLAAGAPVVTSETAPDGSSVDRYPHGLAVTASARFARSLSPLDPLSAESTAALATRFDRDGWSVAVETEARLTCTAEQFVVESHVAARESGVVVHEQRKRYEIRRDNT